MLDDLSYSNIVNKIQGSEIKGADVLYHLSNDLENVCLNIKKLENELNKMRQRKDTIIEASFNIVKHLNKKLPLVVKRNDCVIILNQNDIKIERNVI